MNNNSDKKKPQCDTMTDTKCDTLSIGFDRT